MTWKDKHFYAISSDLSGASKKATTRDACLSFQENNSSKETLVSKQENISHCSSWEKSSFSKKLSTNSQCFWNYTIFGFGQLQKLASSRGKTHLVCFEIITTYK